MKEIVRTVFKIIPHKDKRYCCAYRCKNPRSPKDRFCGLHRHRYTKAMSPISYVYNSLKSNAKRRNKDFKLTLEEFTKFCEETNYMSKRGKTGKSASIDRIDNNKGYEVGNIRILTLSENSQKWTHDEDPGF